jgi:hypothetical protein
VAAEALVQQRAARVVAGVERDRQLAAARGVGDLHEITQQRQRRTGAGAAAARRPRRVRVGRGGRRGLERRAREVGGDLVAAGLVHVPHAAHAERLGRGVAEPLVREPHALGV